MPTFVTKDLVERRLAWVKNVPSNWDVPQNGGFLELSLKMCQLSTLKYSFTWTRDREVQPTAYSMIEQPSKILHIDLSLNDLQALHYDGLAPFRNLRSLDASINRISNCIGLEIIPQLRYLNLSHNFIQRFIGFEKCQELTELVMSMNNIRELDTLPRLDSLTILHLDHNELETIQGIHVLSNLRELYLQRNRLDSILPLTGCMWLRILNAGQNRIDDLRETCETLKTLKKLETVTLMANPIAHKTLYKDAITKSTSISFLDGANIRVTKTHGNEKSVTFDRNIEDHEYEKENWDSKSIPLDKNMQGIADVTRQIFLDQIEKERDIMKADIYLLQKRIADRQTQFKEYEAQVQLEMQTTTHHLQALPDHLPGVQLMHKGVIERKAPLPSYRGIPLKDEEESIFDDELPKPKKSPRKEHKDVKSTDELLRLAFNELTRQQANKDAFAIPD